MANLDLEIISPNGVLFKGTCAQAVIPSQGGDIGFMHGHEMVVAMLKEESKIDIFDEKQDLIKSIEVESGGFAEMQSVDKLLVLVD